MDILSPQRRSQLMARIKSKDSEPEMIVRRLVFGLGRRYRLHLRKLPGCPDLVFSRDRKIVFVHGCFWHQHARCNVARMPRSRLSYWRPKLEGNRRRDLSNARRLRRSGWSVLTVRECELSNLERVAVRLAEFLNVGITRSRSISLARRPQAAARD
jgi:DNA mismatch endonuclease (patch repair protein)